MLKIKKINLLLVLVIIANIKSKENNKKKINNFIYTKAIIATVFIGLLYKLYYKKNHFIQNEKKINTELNTAIEPHNDSTENIESATKSIGNSDFNTITLDQTNQKSENISDLPSEQSVQKEEKTNIQPQLFKDKIKEIIEIKYNKTIELYSLIKNEITNSFYNNWHKSRQELFDPEIHFPSFPRCTKAIRASIKDQLEPYLPTQDAVRKNKEEIINFIKTTYIEIEPYLPTQDEIYHSFYNNWHKSRKELFDPEIHFPSFPPCTKAIWNTLKNTYGKINEKNEEAFDLVEVKKEH